MAEVKKIAVAAMEALRDEATKNGKVSEDGWADKNVQLTAGLLRGDPLRYRSYGPYWWLVKAAMIRRGIDEFGDFVDGEWFANMDYGNEFHNLLAALLYSNRALDMGLIHSNAHNVELLPAGEDQEEDVLVYVLADDDMELLDLSR